MPTDFRTLLWLLKLGALVNFYLLAETFRLPSGAADPHIVIPAQILFVVSAYRCVFPNRYKDNVVLHNTVLSSTLVTRFLATLVEVSWIYQFSYVLRLLNTGDVGWVDTLSWLMVALVVMSQAFVWCAILAGRLLLYFYEELGWALIFVANTIASAYLYVTTSGLGERELLLQLSLLFGAAYLPWQLFHLRALSADANTREQGAALSVEMVTAGLRRSLHDKRPATDADSWGGIIGLTWMTAYWASLIPLWVHQVVVATAR
jgi:hypothetical protein